MASHDDMKRSGIEVLGESTIVSFDIAQEDASRRSIIQRFLYGRTETRVVNGGERRYTYPGLLEEGGFRMGQSVYLLPPDLASRLIVKLREMGIRHRCWDVIVQG